MRNLLVLIISLTSIQLSANSRLEETKQAWARTGYGVAELFAEQDFQATNCMAKGKTYVGCLVTLNSLLGSLDENKHELIVNDLSELEIVPIEEDTLLNPIANSEDNKEKREAYELSFGTISPENLESVIGQTQVLASANLSEESEAYVAGSHFGLLLNQAYDPRSGFLPKELFGPRANKFQGIGARITKYESDVEELNGSIAMSPLVGSPAASAGLVRGDLLLAVDGEPVNEEELSAATERIKGPAGTDVTLTIHSVCENKEKEVVVTRGPIVDKPDWVADAKFISLTKGNSIDDICAGNEKPGPKEPQALYLPLTTFQEEFNNKICSEFGSLQIKDLNNPNSLGIILDLRYNTGGSLEAVTCMLDAVIRASQPMIGQLPVEKGEIVEGAEVRITHAFSPIGAFRLQDGSQKSYNKPIIVLVNEYSASASEIFAGTMQDMKRGWIIGDKTFGKGSVQTYRPHQLSAELKEAGDKPIMIGRTTAIYTLPSGRSPQQVGIMPDFRVDNLGEPIVDKEDGEKAGEASSLHSIAFESVEWEQTRGEEIAQLSSCAAHVKSNSSRFKKAIEEDERYKRPHVANYQLELAKDVLFCTPVVEPLK